MTPDVIFDQLIGAGCARRLVFSWGGNPGVGSLHRLRDAVEHGWPGPLELEEHSHAGMAAAYAAGAATCRLAYCAATRAPTWPNTPSSARSPVRSRASSSRQSPRTGPTSASSMPSRPTAAATSSYGESSASRRRSCLPPRARSSPSRSWSTSSSRSRRASSSPGGSSTLSASSPGGAHPSYAHGYYDRDNDFYVGWDEISRDRDRFTEWIDRHVRGTATRSTGAAGERDGQRVTGRTPPTT